MRTTRLAAAALAAATALTLAACSSGDTASTTTTTPETPTASASFEAGTTMAELAEAGAMTVGTKFDQPGFGFKGLSETPEGFDVKIAELVAAKLGISPDGIEWKETPSAVREEVLERGEVDMVVATYTINEERAQRIAFAGPYYVAGQQLMVRSDNTTIMGPEDLKANPNSKVCSVTGSTPSENIKEYLAAPGQLVLFDVYDKCADALRTNQVDVVTTDNVILLGFVSESDGAFKLVGEQFTDEPYGIGIPKGDTAFCEFINETLTEAGESGAYLEAWNSTAGEVEGAEEPTLPELEPCV